MVNKVGTYVLALAAKEAGIPIYAMATTLKISPGQTARIAAISKGCDDDFEEKDVDEVTASWSKDIDTSKIMVRNIYFESTPLDLFTGIICERGVIHVNEIKDIMRRLKKDYKNGFDLMRTE